MVIKALSKSSACVTSAAILISAAMSAAVSCRYSSSLGSRQPIDLHDIVDAKSIDSLSLSPDGQRIAYRVVSPSVSSNSVSVQWFAISLAESSVPVPLGRPQISIFLPLFDMIADGVSRWTTDSHDLIVLENEGSAIEIHRVGADGADVAVSHDMADVENFFADKTGKMLRYQVRADRTNIDIDQMREEARGVHLDADVFADGMRLTRSFGVGARMLSVRDSNELYPVPAFAGPLKERVLDLPPGIAVQTGSPATDPSAGINPFQQKYVLRGDLPALADAAGNRFTLRKESEGTEDLPLAVYRLTVSLAAGKAADCTAAECAGSPTSLRQILVDRLHRTAILIREEHPPSARPCSRSCCSWCRSRCCSS